MSQTESGERPRRRRRMISSLLIADAAGMTADELRPAGLFSAGDAQEVER